MEFYSLENIKSTKGTPMIAVRISCGEIYLNDTLTKLMKLNVGDKIRFGYDARLDMLGISIEKGEITLLRAGGKSKGLVFRGKAICRDILGDSKKTKRYEYKEFKDGIYCFIIRK